ncbi:MAG: SapC family protein [Lachnospiraceae bacterium]|nr:SapC family protein [Lachnospiraceae bacterium]
MPAHHIVPLSSKNHASLTYRTLNDYSFATSKTTVPLLTFEVPSAAECYPIIFADEKSAVPYALLGLGDKNIFVDDQGHWKAPYLPLLIANYPFSIIEARFTADSEGKRRETEYAVGIDEDAAQFHASDGEPLFDSDGKVTETLTRIRNALLAQYRRHNAVSQDLSELRKVLITRSVTVQYNGVTKNVGGLRCVDQEKIFAMPNEILGKWVKSGMIEMVYAHWRSMRNLRRLLEDPSCPEGNKKESNYAQPLTGN